MTSKLSYAAVIEELSADAVEVAYLGPATLSGSGRGRLHRRVGGIGEMLWEALDRAGWIGELATVRMTISLRAGVGPAPAPESRQSARFAPLPGRARHLRQKGRVDDQGVVWQQFVGPLNGRAAGPAYQLRKAEHHPEDLEFGEDMLYTAGVQAGWLTGTPDEVVDVADVRITVDVARRNPTWEAFANASAGTRVPDTDHDTPNASPEGEPRPAAARAVGAIDESDLLSLAMEVAARNGDPKPQLIQHARGSRFEVTRTTGSVVFSDAPSYIIVMKGNFRACSPRRPGHRFRDDHESVTYPFQTLVIDIETGKITDSGSSNQAPALTALGDVVTDHLSD